MTCQHCKYQWCWICGGLYTYNHYSTGPCAGMQFKKVRYINNKCYKCKIVILTPVLSRVIFYIRKQNFYKCKKRGVI